MNRATVAVFLLGFAVGLARASAQARRVELDHVFIVVAPGAASEIAALSSAGLTVLAQPTRHDGQGTASVAVLFANVYFELIWIDSTVSVDPQHASTLEWFRKAAAWRSSGRSPFGLGLRRLPGDTAALTVPVKREPATWLGPGAAYELLHQPADSLAADFFVVPAQAALPTWIGRARQRDPASLRHPGGGREVTLVRVHGAAGHVPAAFQVLMPMPVEFVRASSPLLEIRLDGGTEGNRVDMRPILPLVLVR